ncbi:MAG: hypothetical protein HY037_04925 [Nitrospirae bacterium]|nr:hypothetical protein [Candidatus Troglogloeales bacterium]
MEKGIRELETRRDSIYRQIEVLKDFRPGTISVNYRRCGKKNCTCHQKDHPGHGPQYLWNTTRKGKSLAQNLRLGPELDKVQKEVETYKQFDRLCQEAIEVNEQICRLRPVPEIEDEKELDTLKKKLQRRFFRRRKR